MSIVKRSEEIQEVLYEKLFIDGKYKPRIINKPEESEIILAETESRDAIIFGDKLLHGGAFNKASTPRVSLEFTCCI